MDELTPKEDEYDPNEDYPPKGTPETALVVVIDCENYWVIAHTGRYFHAQCVCAGFNGEECLISGVPDGDSGIYVFENGEPWSSRDWETGIVDDYGIDGDWRLPTPEDFERFGFRIDQFIDLSGWQPKVDPKVGKSLARAMGQE